MRHSPDTCTTTADGLFSTPRMTTDWITVSQSKAPSSLPRLPDAKTDACQDLGFCLILLAPLPVWF